jgi:hypothetical protein
MSMFTGELLRPPALRFDYSSTSARHSNARQGLRTYGPYDSGILGKDRIRAAVIFPSQCAKEKDALVGGLTNRHSPFTGFRDLFRVPLSIEGEWPLSTENEGEARRVVQNLARQGNVDLVLILTTTQDGILYRTVKQELLGNGIPSQVVTVRKLRDSKQIPWVLENVALACYAKIGGTPWVVASDENRRELVIGISRAQDRNKQFIVGFVTLFNQDGDFLLLHSLAPVLEWEQKKYVRGLTELIIEAYHEQYEIHGTPESIVLHLCKRPGRFREVEAVQQALQQIGDAVPYALLHLNDDSSFRLFDAGHSTYIPRAGLKVELGQRNALLLLDGRIGDRRNRRGVPRVLDISMDKRSTMPADEFPRLVRQIYNFARVNWRGFNALAVPATLNYSWLIARLIVEIGADGWNHVISAGRLRDKAWFL